MDYKVVFEYDEFFNKIIMKIVSNDRTIFYETVTDDVLNVVEKYKNR